MRSQSCNHAMRSRVERVVDDLVCDVVLPQLQVRHQQVHLLCNFRVDRAQAGHDGRALGRIRDGVDEVTHLRLQLGRQVFLRQQQSLRLVPLSATHRDRGIDALARAAADAEFAGELREAQCLLVFAPHQVDVGEVRRQHGRARVELVRAPRLLERGVEAADLLQQDRIPVVRRGLVRLQRDREEKAGLGIEQVAAFGVDLRQHGVRLADVRIERQRLPCRLLGHRQVLLLVAFFAACSRAARRRRRPVPRARARTRDRAPARTGTARWRASGCLRRGASRWRAPAGRARRLRRSGWAPCRAARAAAPSARARSSACRRLLSRSRPAPRRCPPAVRS